MWTEILWNNQNQLQAWADHVVRQGTYGGFPLTDNFLRTGTEQYRKAREHARVSREQENCPFHSVPRQVESSSTLSVLSMRKRHRMI